MSKKQRPNTGPTDLRAELESGFSHLRAGRPAEAEKRAARILASLPHHPGALNLSGLAALEVGNADQAVKQLGKASKLDPGQAIYFCNLGAALRQLRKHDESIRVFQMALDIQPDYQHARVNLGAACFAAARYDDALAAFDVAATDAPEQALHHAYRGDALRELGRIRQAVEAYEQALAIDADLTYALGNFGLTLLGIGQAERSESLCRRATELQPDDGDAWMNLGTTLRALGRLRDAMDVYATAHECSPDSAELCAMIAAVWLETGDTPQAMGWYHRACALDPELLAAQCGLATSTQELGDPEGAAKQFREILEERPDCAAALQGLGAALWEDGDAEGAVGACREAVALRPEDAHCLTQLASIQASAGDVETANATNRRALEINPNCAPALTNLAQNLRGKLPEENVQSMEQLLAANWPRDGVRASLHFGLGHYHDGRKEYDQASQHTVEANRLHMLHKAERGWSYDPADYERHVDSLIERFTPEFFEKTRALGDPSDTPVFIVGMPRSGTTLTEQILASHPHVFGVGERPFASRGFARLPAVLGKQEASPLDCLDDLTADAVGQIAAWHLGCLKKLADKGDLAAGARQRIVDKMPDNYSQLGWIVTAFPNAKIIHTRRDVRDIAVSCWVTQFKEIRWAFDLAHLAERIVQYGRLMEHWQNVLPVPMLEIDYEKTVSDQAGQTERLLEFIGMPWDDRCMEFHKTERLVRTASVTQVRQPIYSRSVERWRRYERVLKPLLNLLEKHN